MAKKQRYKSPHHEYGEEKKKLSLTVTETGSIGFRAIAKNLGISVSKLVEEIARGNVTLDGHPTEKRLLGEFCTG
ncbi:MAG: hypothetical protein SW833_16600 [Cyanobacteriota bacterium]|nr:hypothetical protein [Cyanobacteriota bacterium]